VGKLEANLTEMDHGLAGGKVGHRKYPEAVLVDQHELSWSPVRDLGQGDQAVPALNLVDLSFQVPVNPSGNTQGLSRKEPLAPVVDLKVDLHPTMGSLASQVEGFLDKLGLLPEFAEDTGVGGETLRKLGGGGGIGP
jgi:hypothetical protein